MLPAHPAPMTLLQRLRATRDAPAYVDTPAGLLSADGVHYHTTEALLREYAGPLLHEGRADAFVRRSGVWLRSPVTVGILVAPLLLLVLPWPAALVTALGAVVAWRLASPALPDRLLARGFEILENPIAQILCAGVPLTLLAYDERFAALTAGLVAFVVLRLGLVTRGLTPLLKPALERLYRLPVPDQVLRGFLIREALRRGTDLPGFPEDGS